MKLKNIKIVGTLVLLLAAVLLVSCGGVENQVDDVVVCKDSQGNYYAVSSDGETFLYYYPGNESDAFCVPDGIVRVADGAFEGASNLKELTFADTVKEIGNIFYEYIPLESLTIPSSVTSYRDSTFEIHTRTLRELVLECEIGGFHVGGCDNLEKIVLATVPKSFGSLALDGCGRLTSIVVLGEEPARDSGFEAYCAEKNGYPVLYIPNGVEELSSELINSCVNVYIPDSVQEVPWDLYRYAAVSGRDAIVSMPKSVVIAGAPAGEESADLYSASEIIRRED